MRPVVRDSHRAQTSVHASRWSLGAGNGTRTRDVQLGRLTLYQLSYSRIVYLGHHFGTVWWRGEDSNLRRLSQQIYSLPPLAAREPLPLGAGDGTRTRNLLITNQLLYRLSYASKAPIKVFLVSRLPTLVKHFLSPRRLYIKALSAPASIMLPSVIASKSNLSTKWRFLYTIKHKKNTWVFRISR